MGRKQKKREEGGQGSRQRNHLPEFTVSREAVAYNPSHSFPIRKARTALSSAVKLSVLLNEVIITADRAIFTMCNVVQTMLARVLP